MGLVVFNRLPLSHCLQQRPERLTRMAMTTEGGPKLGTPMGRLAATRALIAARRSIVLDALWTAEVEAVPSGEALSQEQQAALEGLVEEMRAELDQIAAPAQEVRSMLLEASDED